jgi:uncharacterized protein YegL
MTKPKSAQKMSANKCKKCGVQCNSKEQLIGHLKSKHPIASVGKKTIAYVGKTTFVESMKGPCRNGAGCKNKTCAFQHPGKVVAEKVTETRKKVVTKTSPPIDMNFVIDASSSMRGEAISACQEAVIQIYNSMRVNDFVGVSSFTHEPPTPLSGFGFKAQVEKNGGILSTGLRHLQASGGTALWDAIGVAVDQLSDRKERYDSLWCKANHKGLRRCKLVLLTDGADQHSSCYDFEKACARVAKPGFVLSFVLIAVGVDKGTLCQLESLCSPAHAKLVQVSNVRDIGKAFHWVQEQIVKEIRTVREVVSTHTEIVNTTSGGGKNGGGKSGGAGGGAGGKSKFCSNCGSRAGGKFCSGCGQKL